MSETRFINGWSVLIVANDGRPTSRIIARSPEGQRAIHLDRQTDEMVEAFDPDQHWSRP